MNLVSVCDGSRAPIKVPDVLVVYVDVHEAPERDVVGKQIFPQFWKLRYKGLESFADGTGVGRYRSLLGRKTPQRTRYVQSCWHVGTCLLLKVGELALQPPCVSANSSGRKFDRSSASTQLANSTAVPSTTETIGYEMLGQVAWSKS